MTVIVRGPRSRPSQIQISKMHTFEFFIIANRRKLFSKLVCTESCKRPMSGSVEAHKINQNQCVSHSQEGKKMRKSSKIARNSPRHLAQKRIIFCGIILMCNLHTPNFKTSQFQVKLTSKNSRC